MFRRITSHACVLVIVSTLALAHCVAGVLLGIDVLEQDQFSKLQGKRIGLITNATGIDSQGQSTIDVLRAAPGIKLVALFGPEHGVYGADYAGNYVESSKDPHTGLVVYSLYGKTKEPTPEMLQNIDVLMYDIQDIGCRSYTFISTLGNCMDAAGQAHIPIYVLDRPDPLGGNRVEGMRVSPGWGSFVAPYDIPYVYGMTPGELATLIVRKHWIKHIPALTVVPMANWKRSMTWDETGLLWIPTSPHIPTAESAFDYVITGMLGESGGVNHGIGYTLPFGLVGHPSLNSFAFTQELSGLDHSGAFFSPSTWKPFYGDFKAQVIHGSQIFLPDKHRVNLMHLALNILCTLHQQPTVHLFQASPSGDSGPAAFDQIAGGDSLRQQILSGKTPQQIEASWQAGINVFKDDRLPCLIPNYGPDSP